MKPNKSVFSIIVNSVSQNDKSNKKLSKKRKTINDETVKNKPNQDDQKKKKTRGRGNHGPLILNNSQ